MTEGNVAEVAQESIKKTYAYHKPSDGGLDKIGELRALFSRAHETIESLCPHSRERSLAITWLETTAMWAIKSLVCNDPESKTEGNVVP